MTDLNEQRLLQLNRLGIIPGPDEEAAEFIRRAEYCLNLKHELSKSLNEYVPFEIESEENPEILKIGCCKTEEVYDMAPVWIPLFFSNYQLALWHGGCAWIFQAKEDSPTGALFQLRSSFKKNSRYLKLYDRDELITHELCHVGRMCFDEPQFEEFFAYQTSSSSFRRWLGPIVESSNESMFFVVILFLVLVVNMAFISSGSPLALKVMIGINFIPLILIAIAGARLGWRHSQFNQSLENLKSFLGEKKARAVHYRLKDAEIRHFAKISPEEIKQYAASQNSLRWDLIRKSYF